MLEKGKKQKSAIIIALLATTIILSATLTQTSITTAQPAAAQEQGAKTLGIGYFPNIIHAQAVIGLGKGDFQKALGSNIKVENNRMHAHMHMFIPRMLFSPKTHHIRLFPRGNNSIMSSS